MRVLIFALAFMVSASVSAFVDTGEWVVSYNDESGHHTDRIAITSSFPLTAKSVGMYYPDDGGVGVTIACAVESRTGADLCWAVVGDRAIGFNLDIRGDVASGYFANETNGEQVALSLFFENTPITGYKDYPGSEYKPGIYDVRTGTIHLHSITYQGARYELFMSRNDDDSFTPTFVGLTQNKPSESFDGFRLHIYNIYIDETLFSLVMQFQDGVFRTESAQAK